MTDVGVCWRPPSLTTDFRWVIMVVIGIGWCFQLRAYYCNKSGDQVHESWPSSMYVRWFRPSCIHVAPASWWMLTGVVIGWASNQCPTSTCQPHRSLWKRKSGFLIDRDKAATGKASCLLRTTDEISAGASQQIVSFQPFLQSRPWRIAITPPCTRRLLCRKYLDTAGETDHQQGNILSKEQLLYLVRSARLWIGRNR